MKIISILIFLVANLSACAQQGNSSSKLEYIKFVAIAGKDPASSIDKISELGWSPISLAWSPDKRHIAFYAQSARPFGIVDIETNKITPIKSEFEGEGSVHWLKRNNLIVLVQKTAFSVYDANTSTPKLVYTVENKFPKLLLIVSSAIIDFEDEDYLILVGNTNWRLNKDNPHIIVYHLKTGKVKWTYQFINKPFDDIYRTGEPANFIWSAVAGKKKNGDILIIVAGGQVDEIIPWHNSTSLIISRVVKVINLNSSKLHCSIALQQYENPWRKEGMLSDPRISILQDKLIVINDKHITHVFDVEDCRKVRELETELHEPFIDYSNKYLPLGQFASSEMLAKHKPPVWRTYASPDGRWLFGESHWQPKRSNAPFRFWRSSDWSLIHDGTYEDDGAVTAAAFSQDGEYFAWGTSNRIGIYKIRDR